MVKTRIKDMIYELKDRSSEGSKNWWIESDSAFLITGCPYVPEKVPEKEYKR